MTWRTIPLTVLCRGKNVTDRAGCVSGWQWHGRARQDPRRGQRLTRARRLCPTGASTETSSSPLAPVKGSHCHRYVSTYVLPFLATGRRLLSPTTSQSSWGSTGETPVLLHRLLGGEAAPADSVGRRSI
jgi:hypothetical protein